MTQPARTDLPPRSTRYHATMDGRPLPVYETPAFHYAVLTLDGPETRVRVTTAQPFKKAVVRPLRPDRGITSGLNELEITLRAGEKVAFLSDDSTEHPLFLLANARIPRPGRVTHYYEGGRVHTPGRVTLHTGDRVYIEEGAVVVGQFDARDSEDIHITGNGILLGTPLHARKDSLPGTRCMVRFIACRNISVSGLTIVDGPGWHVVPVACTGVRFSDLNVLSVVITGDGIDVVGSEDVDISGCFFRTNDDCIVLKGNHYDDPRGLKSVRGVRARRCVLWKARGGNALEIGYETSCPEICDVLFEDMDVIHCEREGHMSGGVFTIHNGDRACVHDVTYRNIRVEHAGEKLVDFKITESCYSSDRKRGTIQDITFEDIQVLCELPPSILRGCDAAFYGMQPTWISGVRFKNLTVNGQKVTNLIAARMIAEISRDITFE